MKIVLTGDNHLGKRQYNNPTREKDFQNAWLWVCNKVAEINPEFFVVAGDLFDSKHIVNPVTLSVAVDGLMQAGGLSVVIAIEGNHDGRSFINKGRSWLEYLHERGFVNHILRPGKGMSWGGTSFYGSQWAGRSTISAFENAAWEIEASPSEDYLNVGVFHAAPEGYVMGAGTIPPDMLLNSKFDLILMGHCHRPFNINDKVLCAGSPEICDIGEVGNGAGIWVVDIDEDREMSFEFIEYEPRSFVRLEVNPLKSADLFYGDDVKPNSVVIVDVVGQRTAVNLLEMRIFLQKRYEPTLIRINDRMVDKMSANAKDDSSSLDALAKQLLAGAASVEEFNSLFDCFESSNASEVISILLEVI